MFFVWYFILYSLLGFLLEVAFARVTGHPKRDRKCLLVLPLCPVYGLGALLIRGLSALMPSPLWVMAAGFVGATISELAMGALYRYGLGVEFWDYRRLRWNLGGLVCLQFSLCWTVLALGLVYGLDPWMTPLLAAIPPWLGPPAVVILVTDLVVSAVALRQSGTTEVLRWYL